MPLEIFENIVQGSPEWVSMRLGLATASCFSDVLAGGQGKTRATYMRRLAGEILCGEPAETFKSAAMERGQVVEAEAVRAYELLTDQEIKRVGFITNHGAGYSPDGLIGEDGSVEFKSMKPELLLDVLERKPDMTEHKPQCQGGLWISERRWIDLVIYYPKMPMYIRRFERDPAYIASLAAAVKAFQADVAAMVERHRG